MSAREVREREICWCCGGKGVLKGRGEPGKWFTDMGLTYVPDVEFEVRPQLNADGSDTYYDEVHYNGHVTDDGIRDYADEYVAQYNDKLRDDIEGRICVECRGVGTVPKPLDRDEQIYDRGELMMEAFAAGGMQGYYDMQDEWSEYVSGRGSYADPLQRQIDAEWDAQHRDSYEDWR